MHKIIAEDAALKELDDTRAAALEDYEAYEQRVQQAREKHEAAHLAALEAGEVWAPVLEPIGEGALLAGKQAARDRALSKHQLGVEHNTVRLQKALAEREQAILKAVPGTAARDLPTLCEEIRELAATRQWIRRYGRGRSSDGPQPSDAPAVSVSDLLAAAATGGSLIGPIPGGATQPSWGDA